MRSDGKHRAADEGMPTRREFLKDAAILGTSIASSVVLPGCVTASTRKDAALQTGSADTSIHENDTSPAGKDGATSTSKSDGTSTGKSGGTSTSKSGGTSTSKSDEAPAVYMTTDISSKGIAKAYSALGFEPTKKMAVKLSTGEPGGENYLHADLIGDLITSLGATIVECNTAYGGQRSTTESHRKVAVDHGFTAIADVDIMDADGSLSLPVEGGTHLIEDLVGSHFQDYGSFLSLAHFKGHTMGGFGGAIKNISIGIASSEGKLLIHSAGVSSTSWNSAAQDDFLESMAEAAKAICDHLADTSTDGQTTTTLARRICFVNVMNRLSVDCDCDSNPAEPDMKDIGILASMDPVALDQACVDLVFSAPDGASLVERITSRNGIHTLEHAESLGLGSRTYRLISLD